MFGFDIESLRLEVSIDNGDTWEVLSRHDKNQGDLWYRNTLSLSKYDGFSGIFRFVAVSPSGILGQIALDQIEFYNTLPSSSLYTYYRDRDQDGYGSDAEIIRTCQNTPPDGYSASGDDCDDDNILIFPGADEIMCNGTDENCNGMADDSPTENPIMAEAQVSSPYCNGSADGAISLMISGGQPPYEVLWNNGNSGQTVSELTEGIYYARITDSEGCILRTNFFNLQPQNVLNAAITEVVQPTCEGKSDGSLTVSHSVDNPPHLYIWSNGQTEKTISNLSSGTYSVTVTDRSGCFTSVRFIDLEARPRIQSSLIESRSQTCFGQNNGLLDIFASGGQGPYSFVWNTGDTTSRITSLPAGTFVCTVTDAEGCLSVLSTELEAPEPLTTTLTNTENPRCFGEKNGSVKTHARGGTAPYTYFWNRHPVFTDDIFELSAGDYVLTVTDRNGCTAVLDTVRLRNPDIITITIDSLAATSCQAGATGYISVSAEGGNGGFNYVWQNVDKNSPFIDSLTTGHYSLTVFDKLGCKQSIPNIFVPFVNNPVDIQLSLERDNVCFNERNGLIVSQILSGQAPYDYNWSQGSQYFNDSSVDTLMELPRGNYRLTVTDALGCVGISNNILVSEGLPVSYEVTQWVSPSCQDSQDGEISLEVSGGKPPYDIIWNNGLYTGSDLTMLASNAYTGIITDSLGCMFPINTLLLEALSDIEINSDITHVTENMPGQICLQLTGGILPYQIIWSTGERDVFCIDNLTEGSYQVTVTDALLCQVNEEFIIERSTAIADPEDDPLRVYPNPFTDVIYINNPFRSGHMKLLQMTGSVLLEMELLSGMNALDGTSLTPGIYMLRIEAEEHTKHILVIKI
jgi:hypothetical protein